MTTAQTFERMSQGRSIAAGPWRVSLGRTELAIILAATFLYWTETLRILFPGTDGASAAFRLVHFGFYGCFLTLVVRDTPSFLVTCRASPLLMVFLIMPMASALWSINLQDTFQRGIAVFGSSLFGLYLATQVHPRLALRLIALTATISAAISLILIALVPSVGLMSEGEYVNVWAGLHMHKNALGQMATLGAVICLIVLLTDGMRGNSVLCVGLALNVLLVAGSRSLTSQLVLVASVFLILTVGRFIRFLVDYAVIVALFVAPLVLIAVVNLSMHDVLNLLASFGKDATMSSRVPLWTILADFIQTHYWFGHGYEAFWTDESFGPRIIEAKLHFRPFYAHNGYVELWLGLGAVGFAIVIGLLSRFTWTAASALYRGTLPGLALLAFVYVPMFLLQNTAEVTILQRNGMAWTLFVVMYAYLALGSDFQSRRAGAPQTAPAMATRRIPVR